MRTLEHVLHIGTTDVVRWLESSNTELTLFAWGLSDVWIRGTLGDSDLTPDQLMAIDAVHEAVLKVQEATGKAIGKTKWDND